MRNVRVVVGIEWGDEGKGKVVDYLSRGASLVARAQGGNNAGHTIMVKNSSGEFEALALHTFPSAVAHGKTICIGASVVIDPTALILEARHIASYNLDPLSVLNIDPRCTLVMLYHRVMDMASELKRKRRGDEIGTTARGIGPTYADVANRINIRMRDMIDAARFEKLVHQRFEEKTEAFRTMGITREEWTWIFKELTIKEQKANRRLLGLMAINAAVLNFERFMADDGIGFNMQAVVEAYMAARETILGWHRFTDVSLQVNTAICYGEEVIIEGAQGTHLDSVFGTEPPFVTASRTIAGGCCDGLGVGPTMIGEVIGVMKAYTTRVGNGPFPSRITNDLARRLQGTGEQVDDERGATTGRVRDVGWPDTVLTRSACMYSGVTKLAIMKLDRLTGIPELQIATEWTVDGKSYRIKPPDVPLTDVDVKYMSVPGWTEDIRGARKIDDLPHQARYFLNALKGSIQNGLPSTVSIGYIGTGPGPDDIIDLSA